MIKEIKYKVLTDEEAVWSSLRSNSVAIDTILRLRKGDTLKVSYPISIEVDIETAKRIAREYIDENSNYR